MANRFGAKVWDRNGNLVTDTSTSLLNLIGIYYNQDINFRIQIQNIRFYNDIKVIGVNNPAWSDIIYTVPFLSEYIRREGDYLISTYPAHYYPHDRRPISRVLVFGVS